MKMTSRPACWAFFMVLPMPATLLISTMYIHAAMLGLTLKTLLGRVLSMFLMAMALTGTFPVLAAAGTVEGVVVGVTDGDTVKVLDADKKLWTIRLFGIDTPKRRQPFGERAKQSLSDMVFQKTVTVEGEKNDRYGRLVGKVLVSRRDVNLAQINAGLAWHYKKYQKEQTESDRDAYAAAEQAAIAAKLGLWSEPNPVPPWDWRKNGRASD